MGTIIEITIDCPPGWLRPGHIAAKLGMEDYTNTARMFGEWIFVKEYEDQKEGEVFARKTFEALKGYYEKELVRYVSWDILTGEAAEKARAEIKKEKHLSGVGRDYPASYLAAGVV